MQGFEEEVRLTKKNPSCKSYENYKAPKQRMSHFVVEKFGDMREDLETEIEADVLSLGVGYHTLGRIRSHLSRLGP